MAKKKATTLDQDSIVSMYTDYCLSHGKKPSSVYDFAKKNEFEEQEFYKFFSSFEQIENHYFSIMFNVTIDIVTANKDYNNYEASQKLSSFYFTFFEMATANRSFVKYLLEGEKIPLKNVSKLKELRSDFLSYIKTILEAPMKSDSRRIENVQNRIIHEGAWLQFMSIMAYWLRDVSPSFEKTDVFIEKSVKASFDIVYNVPIESIVDFGKFLWKEGTASFSSK
jgi:hypothetical protein